MDDNSSKSLSFPDNMAVVLSGVCLLHCLTLPVLIALIPFMSQFGEGHFHVQMLLVVLPVSIMAFSLGFRRHRVKSVITWGGIGMLLLVFGATVVHDSFGLVADRTVTICAALILAFAHYFNNKFSRHGIVKN
jgi:MerC mercury resistance protein